MKPQLFVLAPVVLLVGHGSETKNNAHAAGLDCGACNGQRGDGPETTPLECKTARPHGVFVDKKGIVYIGDSEAHRVRVMRKR